MRISVMISPNRGAAARKVALILDDIAAHPVGYAIDPITDLSATPSTPIEAVAGAGDRSPILSATPSTRVARPGTCD